MNNVPARLQRLLPPLWLGMLLSVAGIATASAFASLPMADAGKVVARVLSREAATSLILGAVWLALDRVRVRRDEGRASSAQFNMDVALAMGAVFSTVAGYYALQPMMEQARQGQGPLSFAQWHGISLAFYGVKLALVALLAWRATLGESRAAGVSPLTSS